MGKGRKKSETSKQAPTRKTKDAMDRRQNKKKLWQCPSGIAQRPPHHAVAVPTAMNSHKDNFRSSAVGKQLKQKKSNSQAQLHLPALDLFWANFFMRVRLTSLLISPGLGALKSTTILLSPKRAKLQPQALRIAAPNAQLKLQALRFSASSNQKL